MDHRYAMASVCGAMAIAVVSATIVAVGPPIEFAERVVSVSVSSPTTIHAVDVDGDDDLDIVVGSGHGPIAWYENVGGMPTAFSERLVAPHWAADVCTADIGHDGDADVLSVHPGGGSPAVRLHENIGGQPPEFLSSVVDSSISFATRSISAADLDGDGDTDILTAGRPTPVVWYEQYTDGSLVRHTISSGGDYAVEAIAADLDGDDRLDIVAAMRWTEEIVWYHNTGTLPLLFSTALPLGMGNNPSEVAAGDFDDDGDVDVVVAGSGLELFENDGSPLPTFTRRFLPTSALPARGVVALDFDDDDDVDLVVAGGDRVIWCENTGVAPVVFEEHFVSANTMIGYSAAAGDVDGDGDLDVISASELDAKIGFHEQGGQPGPTVVHVPADFPSIGDGISAAPMHGEVVVAPGRYTEAVDLIGKAITVRSAAGAAQTVIDASDSEYQTPVVTIDRFEGPDTVVQGFTLTGGTGQYLDPGEWAGGGLYIKDSSPTIRSCIITGNSAFAAGGAYWEGSANPTFVRCLFAENSGYLIIAGYGGTPVLDACVFAEASEESFNNVRLSDATSIVRNCRFVEREWAESSALTISNGTGHVDACSFERNAGTGLSIDAGFVTLGDSMFCENHIDVTGAYTDAGGNTFLDICPPAQDVDGDGLVGFTDLLRVLTDWGDCVACRSDLDFDGDVGLSDLLSVLAAWTDR